MIREETCLAAVTRCFLHGCKRINDAFTSHSMVDVSAARLFVCILVRTKVVLAVQVKLIMNQLNVSTSGLTFFNLHKPLRL
jgi:hypothetical protein